MGIEHLIEKYEVSHWRKERLVDLMCNKYFPDIANTQNIKEDVSVVDEAFKKYSDIEDVCKEIGSVG